MTRNCLLSPSGNFKGNVIVQYVDLISIPITFFCQTNSIENIGSLLITVDLKTNKLKNFYGKF